MNPGASRPHPTLAANFLATGFMFQLEKYIIKVQLFHILICHSLWVYRAERIQSKPIKEPHRLCQGSLSIGANGRDLDLADVLDHRHDPSSNEQSSLKDTSQGEAPNKTPFQEATDCATPLMLTKGFLDLRKSSGITAESHGLGKDVSASLDCHTAKLTASQKKKSTEKRHGKTTEDLGGGLGREDTDTPIYSHRLGQG
ncbi:hypothetical protein MATL_G00150400 [Megalops atlanticus]|uniref:Uncharacterized protein n=1 Tax=Megalops atlanticus TaxID=7932 RepID=A0A9D3PWG4_MEGAT|nr:hypothetical protein MATL_G00150400 [Megalops atlanticus]